MSKIRLILFINTLAAENRSNKLRRDDKDMSNRTTSYAHEAYCALYSVIKQAELEESYAEWKEGNHNVV